MSIVFQGNHVSLLSDAYQTLVIQDKALEANGEPHIISGVINSVVVTDNNKKTWIFTVPTWEHVVLSPGQFVHFEGPREYTEDGATFVCLGVSNSGGGQGFLTRQVSSKAHVSHTTATEIELENPPTDSITRVRWSPVDPNLLLVGSWDSSLRLYDVASNTLRSKFEHKAAVLSSAFSPAGDAVVSGGLDCWLRLWDPEKETFRVVSTHEKPISNVLWSPENNTIYTGSWDQTIATHDIRVPTPRTGSYSTFDRVYYMDIFGNHLVVAMAARKFNIYDIRMMERPKQERESSLRFMTGAVACMLNGEGYAAASIEGRVAVEYFDPSPAAQTKKYAFKCHRQAIDGVDHVWPVNALAFHPVHHTFGSAGSDGLVSIWDHTAKKRLRQYPKYHNAVNDISFNMNGTKLAVGVSYGWEKGEAASKLADNARVSVFIREIGDEVKPKAKA